MEIWAKQFKSHGMQVIVEKDIEDGMPCVMFRFKLAEGTELKGGPSIQHPNRERALYMRDKMFEDCEQRECDQMVALLLQVHQQEDEKRKPGKPSEPFSSHEPDNNVRH